MKTGCEKRLDKSFKNAPVLPLYPHSKAVLISDCHRGTGNSNDNFLKNQHLYAAALHYYYSRGFTYIEMGDGDELWENRSISVIREIHSDVFWQLSLFERENRLYMLYGNHDHVMKNSSDQYHEGLILKMCGCVSEDKNSCPRLRCLELYLTHGHQAELLNSTFWKLSRFLVRYLWKPLEQLGVLDPTSAAKNYHRRRKSERRLSAWAVKNNCYLITGHTHRPMLGDENTHYFNTGSCVHPRCITCLEIENASICLVKWFVEVRKDNSLYVAREVLAGPLSLYELGKHT
ncbi:MAG: metallophosphoesterase family protein [Lachnospiraceae bacterium]|nr:metallophosphoesterase family protein [Lachnospiraceae bacterium]MDE6982149.1 metallophosphoesterase family protein [Lachnospiraceae bacterium]